MSKAAVMTDRIPFRVQPMLATLASQPFHKPVWVYEEKSAKECFLPGETG
jgi:hypothetical protein